MNILSLFDGISCGQVAFDKLGVTFDKMYADNGLNTERERERERVVITLLVKLNQ
jgi:hypothetical protein